MNRAELFREYAKMLNTYANCIECADQHNINVGDYIKYNGTTGLDLIQYVEFDPALFEFALLTLDNIPIFIGDTVYKKTNQRELIFDYSLLWTHHTLTSIKPTKESIKEYKASKKLTTS